MRMTADVRHHMGKSAYFRPSVRGRVSWLNRRMQSSSSALNTPQSLCTLLAGYRRNCESWSLSLTPPPPSSGSPPAIGKCPTLPHSLWLIWSSKFHSGTGREPWSIGHTWGEAFPVPPPSSPPRQLRLKTDKYPLQLLRYFPFLAVSLAWCAVSCVPVPVSTFSPPPLFFSSHICSLGSFGKWQAKTEGCLPALSWSCLFFWKRGFFFIYLFKYLCQGKQELVYVSAMQKNQCQGWTRAAMVVVIDYKNTGQQIWLYFNLVHHWTRNLPCLSQTKQNGRSFAICPQRKGSKPGWPENRNEHNWSNQIKRRGLSN